jgi:hypothetical protein
LSQGNRNRWESSLSYKDEVEALPSISAYKHLFLSVQVWTWQVFTPVTAISVVPVLISYRLLIFAEKVKLFKLHA